MVKKKKEIKIVHESEVNYTFLDKGLVDIKQESKDDTISKNNPNMDKDIIKSRAIDSKKAKIRYMDRIMGGHIKQGHSSVYE